MHQTLSRLALGVVVAGALLAIACGGGGLSGVSGNADFNKDPVKFTQLIYLTYFRALTGAATADDMMKLYEDSCRAKVAAADVTRGIEKASELFAKLKGQKIEEIDFGGKAKVTKKDNGATVTVPGAKDARIKVDGKWLNSFDYFKSVGFAEDGDEDEGDDTELVLVNGRYYDAECDNLTDVADSGKRANATPTPTRSTPAPARTTPTATTGNRTPTPSATSRTGATSNLSNAEVEAFTRRYLVMIFSVYTGNAKAEDVLAFYSSECRAKVTTAKVTAGLTRASALLPKMKGEKLEDIDFQGKLKVTATSSGFSVDMPGTRDVRIKVNGSYVNMHTYMQSVGVEGASATGSVTTTQDFIVQNGRLFDADCEFLEDLAG